MKQYVNPTELTAELLNTLIEKILVHAAVKSEDGSREQEVEIFYRFIGKIECHILRYPTISLTKGNWEDPA